MGRNSYSRSYGRIRTKLPPGYKGGPVSGDNDTLFCAGLHLDCDEQRLKDFFLDEGFEVQKVTVPPEFGGSRNRGFGFVVVDARDIDECVKKLDGLDIMGKKVRIEKRAPTSAALRYSKMLARDGPPKPGDKGRGRGRDSRRRDSRRARSPPRKRSGGRSERRSGRSDGRSRKRSRSPSRRRESRGRR